MDSVSDNGLLNVHDGIVPECRMKDARSTQDFVMRVIDADDKREQKRALVAGICDGNLPYKPGLLRKQNRADACNVNWGTARSTLEASVGAFYDLATEAPGIVQIATSHGNEENRVQWSRDMSAEADVMFMQEKSWDSQEQTSLNEMVLFGRGPMFFENDHDVFPVAVEDDALKVPDRTPSDLNQWEICVILREYYPPQLYQFIENEDAAEKVGWDVPYTKKVLENAVDQKTPPDQSHNWLWYQTELKTNSFDYFDNVSVCRVAHVLWKEFDGRVTHAIVERQDTSAEGCKYLFLRVGRYANFYEAIHPMFFDKGRGGYYHNVTGLGVKQYGPLEYENRLLCGLMDAAFAPKILFKPTTQEAATKFQLARFGQWGLVPPGTDVVQTPIQGLMQDGLAMFRTSSDLMRSNLSQYRQTVEPDKPGNPDTATEARMKMSQGGALSNTTFNRYYHQRDLLLSEIVRRACNLNSTDTRAKEFQDRCRRRGVPDECFGRIESVQAVRVVGQGSPFMRREVTQAMLPLMMRLPESGQQNLLDDFISSNAGQSAVNRYNPRSKISAVSGDQKERAGNQVTGMHSGKPADFSPSQDALIFSAVYMQAAVQAMQSVQNGGNPQQVLAFVELAGAAAAKQIRRLSGDPLRQQIGKEFEKQLKQLGNQVDRLKKLMQQQAQQRQKQGQKTAQVMSDIQLRQLETQAKIQDRNLKTRFALQDKAVRSRQQMAINDSQSASQIAINHYRALSE